MVGLGPAGVDLIPPAASARWGDGPCFARTLRHPAAAALPADVQSFDGVYVAADRIEDVYSTIVERLRAAAAESGTVVYAVPGSPVVAETTVELLIQQPDLAVEIVPAMSFVDLAWIRLGIDPFAHEVQLVDGHALGSEPVLAGRALLVGQCDRRDVLSDVKLSVSDAEGLEITVLQRLGLPDESVRRVAWDDLDREVHPDHLTTLYLPPRPAQPGDFPAFVAMVERLRAECPWDREQTHASLRRHLLEETHELLEAIDADDPDAADRTEEFAEELGDVLFQVVLHAVIAGETARFDVADVLRLIHEKLVARHPHVFGDAGGADTAEIRRRWEADKLVEKGRTSIMSGIPVELPALARAAKVNRKLRNIGRDVADYSPAPNDAAAELWAVAQAMVNAGLDPEDELRRATREVMERYESAQISAE